MTVFFYSRNGQLIPAQSQALAESYAAIHGGQAYQLSFQESDLIPVREKAWLDRLAADLKTKPLGVSE